MVAKDSRRTLTSLLFSLLLVAGGLFPVYSEEIQFIELDRVVAPGPVAIDRSSATTLHVLSINLNRFFDDIDDGNDEKVLSRKRFRQRIEITSTALAEKFKLPDIIALQEVENRNVLQQLAMEIQRRYRVEYQAVLIEGNDVSGIDVGYLLRSDLTLKRSDALFRTARASHNDIPLFSRPPLHIEICRSEKCFTLLNLHLRSMRGLSSAKKGDRVVRKRRQQAETLASWIDRWQRDNPRRSLVVLGDLNALTPADRHVDVVGIVRGNPDNRATRLPGKDLFDPDLIDLTLSIPAGRRYSFIFRGRNQQLDYMLVNHHFDAKLDAIAFASIERDLSDHAGLYAMFSWQATD